MAYSTQSKIVLLGFLILFSKQTLGQEYTFLKPAYPVAFQASTFQYQAENDSLQTNYLQPKKVFHRSLIIPGWGQITNAQAWKVPIVYGLIGGLSYYSIYLTKQYHDYRAAYYNSFSENTDFRFGQTPDYLVGQNVSSLKSNRDFLRNRRDFVYVTIGLAWLLNGIDAYVFAHLRTFDVSDDLSMNGAIQPNVISSPYIGEVPSISVTLNLFK